MIKNIMITIDQTISDGDTIITVSLVLAKDSIDKVRIEGFLGTWPVCSVSSLLMRYIRKNLMRKTY